MKNHLTFLVLMLTSTLIGCRPSGTDTKTSSAARPFDINVIYGMSETQTKSVLGEAQPSDANNSFAGGYVREWEKGDLSLTIAFDTAGQPTRYVCDDYRKGVEHTEESMRKEFNVSATDARYVHWFAKPEADGSVTIMHIKPR